MNRVAAEAERIEESKKGHPWNCQRCRKYLSWQGGQWVMMRGGHPPGWEE